MKQHQQSPRGCLGSYPLRFEPTDGDGRFFGLKVRLRYLLRQRPAKRGGDNL